jgi:D-alanyl-D-alanine carboxypeptidase (penicillin-binding protein 5/6)
VDRFVGLMNAEAIDLRLRDTRFYSPNGLDDRGYSTAADLATLTRIAEREPGFADVVAAKTRWIPAPSGPPRHVQNRNVLLWLYPGATGVKTGFTTPAGHCLVATARREGHGLVAVVLGDPDEPFDEGATLLNFGFDAFVPVTMVRQGQAVGAVTVEGARLGAVAGGTLDGWVRRDLVGTVERTLVADPLVRAPVAGQRVGTVIVKVHGRRFGTVPAVAAAPLEAGSNPVGAALGRQPVDDVAAVLGLLVRSVFGSFL